MPPYYGYYERAKPRRTKGGIKAHSRRGDFGSSWWAKRWMQVLNGFNLGDRLDRGKTYARRGQVTSIDVGRGVVKASVQGTYPYPYTVEIRVKRLGKSDWGRLSRRVFSRPAFAAKMLTGRMPDDVEEAFAEAGLSLFPGGAKDMSTECDCPDWSNPCKHIAAVYLLLGEEFDRDPFLIFKMRGMDREELLGMAGLRSVPGAGAPEDGAARPEPLPSEPDAFWGGTAPHRDEEAVQAPAMQAALPKQLGGFPFWSGEEPFMQRMEEMYGMASPYGMDAFLGEGGAARSGPRRAGGRRS